MSEVSMSPDDKYEGFDIWKIRSKAEALESLKELKDKPEMKAAVLKYIEDEIKEGKCAIDLADNL